jgi:hypothetical protein
VIQIFVGFDEREAIGSHTFLASLLDKTTEPFSVCHLSLKSLRKIYGAGQRDGTNAFSFSRFLIPYLQDFKGFAIFADGADMIVKDDIAKLWAMRNPFVAVQVVPHSYQTKHPRKYVGTGMEADNHNYPRKNWSSLQIINCAHYAWRCMTPEKVEKMSGAELQSFSFIPERYIDFLPSEWNHLADEYGPNPDAKLLHWTAGIAAWEHYKDSPHADDWREAHAKVNHAV